jgi:nucleotide-binding universal stress UspA family protein
MSESLFRRVVVPVASEADARATAAALAPHVESATERVVAVNVVEKADGAPDKASVEQREEVASEAFDAVADGLDGTGVPLETRVLYGEDVADAIVDAAHDEDATAIAFTPRGSSTWVKLLTGNVADALVETSDLPVVVIPDVEEGDQ